MKVQRSEAASMGRPAIARRCRFGVAIGSAALVILGGVTALPGTAGATGAQKAPLFTPPFQGVCSVPSGSGTEGFVVINVANHAVSAVVSPKRAAPSNDYDVQLWDSNCSQIASGSIPTNEQGNGTAQLTAAASGNGTYSVTGSASSPPTGDHFASPPVNVS